jgi:hypothetical protein
MAKEWAIAKGIRHIPFPADWGDMTEPCYVKKIQGKQYNALAGSKRNQKMIDEGKPDMAVAFPGGNGTKDMINKLMKANIDVKLVGQYQNA